MRFALLFLLLNIVFLNIAEAATVSDDTCFGADTVLMLHMDGNDGSTTFTDSSSSAHTVTANGDAQIDTAQSKFGGASGLFDGVGDDLEIADNDDFNLTGNDFTADGWVRFNSDASVNGVHTFMEQRIDTNNRFGFQIVLNNTSCPGGLSTSDCLRVLVRDGGTTTVSQFIGDFDIQFSTWYHVAFTRDGTTWRGFLDGTGASFTDADDFQNYTGVFNVMGQTADDNSDIDGWGDEIRVVNGKAVWTGDFTPPSKAYSKCFQPRAVIF